jgi:hypothetical protein
VVRTITVGRHPTTSGDRWNSGRVEESSNSVDRR